MTLFSWVGIGFFVVMLISGICIKLRMRRKVMALEGLTGFVRERDLQSKEKVIGEFGE